MPCPKRHTGCVTSTTCFEAAKPIYEADRYAKKKLKKRVRGVRKIERSVSQEPDNGMNEVVEGYCQAVRAATDDGRPPLDAAGLTLQERLNAIDHSLERVDQLGGLPKPLTQLKRMLSTALKPYRSPMETDCHCLRVGSPSSHYSRAMTRNSMGRTCVTVWSGYSESWSACFGQAESLATGIDHFLKVTCSYAPGLFHCYDIKSLPSNL